MATHVRPVASDRGYISSPFSKTATLSRSDMADLPRDMREPDEKAITEPPTGNPDTCVDCDAEKARMCIQADLTKES